MGRREFDRRKDLCNARTLGSSKRRRLVSVDGRKGRRTSRGAQGLARASLLCGTRCPKPTPYERGPMPSPIPSFLWPSSHRRGSRTARPFNGPPASPTTALLFLPTCSFLRDFGKLGTNMSARFSSSREGEERVCERERGAERHEALGRAKRLTKCVGHTVGNQRGPAQARSPSEALGAGRRAPPLSSNRRHIDLPSVRDLFVDRTLVD